MEGTRTPDPRHAMAVLFQLSYNPMSASGRLPAPARDRVLADVAGFGDHFAEAGHGPMIRRPGPGRAVGLPVVCGCGALAGFEPADRSPARATGRRLH